MRNRNRKQKSRSKKTNTLCYHLPQHKPTSTQPTQPQPPQPQPKPVQCVPNTTTTTTTTTINTTPTTKTTIDPDTELVADKLDQNLFVIPSHNLSRCPESEANISDSGNINVVVIDKLAGADEIAPPDAYEPCYKPSDIFAIYQNRLCFQGKRNAFHISTYCRFSAHTKYILQVEQKMLFSLSLSSSVSTLICLNFL